jgi:hypothetical protein
MAIGSQDLEKMAKTCTQCGQPAAFLFKEKTPFSVTPPNKITTIIPQDYSFCEEHWIMLIREWLKNTKYEVIEKRPIVNQEQGFKDPY